MNKRSGGPGTTSCKSGAGMSESTKTQTTKKYKVITMLQPGEAPSLSKVKKDSSRPNIPLFSQSFKSKPYNSSSALPKKRLSSSV